MRGQQSLEVLRVRIAIHDGGVNPKPAQGLVAHPGIVRARCRAKLEHSRRRCWPRERRDGGQKEQASDHRRGWLVRRHQILLSLVPEIKYSGMSMEWQPLSLLLAASNDAEGLDSKHLNRAGPAKADVVELTTCLQLGNDSALLRVPRRPHLQGREAGDGPPRPLELLEAFEQRPLRGPAARLVLAAQ